ncbi:hypothetical protein [Phyllobacterium zundukense]|uniref:Uncharacterized protein n=1 Tax=Phyllobacterium zundukense TaxID=1867719 RepID=A0ACD4D6U8_9HYPH|nr:hypothetical protein [Phyllobacterium zundukense]UXN61575.1 hypothetical protein N8E88_16070 [Phyllobacterium zundukense]
MEPYEIEALIEERIAAVTVPQPVVTPITPFSALWNRRGTLVPVSVVGIRPALSTDSSFEFVVINQEDGLIFCDVASSLEGDLPHPENDNLQEAA